MAILLITSELVFAGGAEYKSANVILKSPGRKKIK